MVSLQVSLTTDKDKFRRSVSERTQKIHGAAFDKQRSLVRSAYLSNLDISSVAELKNVDRERER